MKKLLRAFAVFAALAMLGTSFVACSSGSDDDDGDERTTYKCGGCGTEYGTNEEKENCDKQEGCPKYVAQQGPVTADGVADYSIKIAYSDTPVIDATATAKIYKGEELVDTIAAKDEKLYAIGAPKAAISELKVADQLLLVEGNNVVVVPHNDSKGFSKLAPETTYKVVLEGVTGTPVKADYSFTTKAAQSISDNVIKVGSADTDNFYTLQGAFNFLMASQATGDWTINVANGEYHEMLFYSGAANVKIVGTKDDEKLPHIYWRNSQVLNPAQRARQSFIWQGGNLTLENLFFENTTTRKVEGNTNVQAETLVFDCAKDLTVVGCKFFSYQDTLLLGNNGGRCWFYDCDIEGDVDFIWGTADVALFENCEIVCLGDGIKNDAKIFASRTVSGDTTAKGYVLMNSHITIQDGCNGAYGRSSGADTQAAAFNNTIKIEGAGKLDPKLWGSPSDTILYEPNGEMAVGYKDYNNKLEADGSVVVTTGRVAKTADMSERLFNREYNGRWTIFNRVYNKKTKAYEFAKNIYDIASVAAAYGAPEEDSINNIYTDPVYTTNVVGGNTVQLANDTKVTGLTYTYESANDLATVDANGLVTTKVGGDGNAVITVTASNGKKDVITIKVIPTFIKVTNVALTAPETVDVYGFNKVTAAITPADASVTTLKWTVTGDLKIVDPNNKNLVTELTTNGLAGEGDFVNIEGFTASGSGTITVTSVDTETAADSKTIAISKVRDYNALEAVAVNSKDAAAGCGILNAQSKVVMWHDMYVEGMLNGSGGKIAASGERVQSRLGKMYIPVTESARIDIQCQKWADDLVIIPDASTFTDKAGKKPTSSTGPESEGLYPYHYTFELDFANDTNKLEEGSEVLKLFNAATKDTSRTWADHTPDADAKYFVITVPAGDRYWTHIRVTPDDTIHHEAPTATLSIANFAAANVTLDLNGEKAATKTTTATVSVNSGTPSIAYASSNESVVKVNATTGEATAVGIGRAKITATASMGELDDVSTSYNVLVKDTKAPEGSYAVDFKSGNLISASTTNNVNLDFGYVKINVGTQNAYGYNGTQHGAMLKQGNSIELVIPAAATVKVGGCQYNNDTSITATVTAGTVTPNTAVAMKGSNNGGTVGCSDTVDFEVSEACTITLAFTGSTTYIPQIEVIAGKAYAEGTYDFATNFKEDKSGEIAGYTLSVNGFETNAEGHSYGCVIKNGETVKMNVKGDCTITFTGSTWSSGNMNAEASTGAITPASRSCVVETDKTGTYSFTYTGGEATLTFTCPGQAYTPSIAVAYTN